MKPSVRADLAGETPYGAPVEQVPVLLNVNENPYPPPKTVVDAVVARVAQVVLGGNRYPDREAIALRQAIATYVGHDVRVDQVWAANGSNEVMHQIFSAFGGPNRTAISFSPTYSMYPQYARDTHTAYLTFPRQPDFSLDLAAATGIIGRVKPAITVIASPNNPTGHVLWEADVLGLLATCEEQGTLLVIDEAYGEFMDPGLPSAIGAVVGSENLIVTRTLSKAFGLAGLRVGYGVAQPNIVDALRVVRLPYHLSSVTQAAAEVALENAGLLLAPVSQIRSERERLSRWAQGIGLRVTPSQGNFIYIGEFRDRSSLWQSLLAMGVLVRESGPEGWLRVSVGTAQENDGFMTSLQEALDRDSAAILSP